MIVPGGDELSRGDAVGVEGGDKPTKAAPMSRARWVMLVAIFVLQAPASVAFGPGSSPNALHVTGPASVVKDQSKKTKVFNFEVPIRVDGKKGVIDGTLFWVGPAHIPRTSFIVAGIAIVPIGGILMIWVRRCRHDEDPSTMQTP